MVYGLLSRYGMLRAPAGVVTLPIGTTPATLGAMVAATIRIFLADGLPLGIRVVDKSNWTGRGTDFARADWARARLREDFRKPGVYILTGRTDDGVDRVYVGEADERRSRLHQHFIGPGAKDFWTRAVAFTSKDENLNKAHVRYLEARLVGLALAAKRAKLENAATPSMPALSEYDRADAESFLDEMLLVLPLIAIDAFTPPNKAALTQPLLYLKGRGITAEGRDTPEGFVVHEGSTAARSAVDSLHEYVRAQRSVLMQNGVLMEVGATYRLTQDYTFNSPSTAAAVMLGRTSNGRIDWKDATGTTLKAIQEQALP